MSGRDEHEGLGNAAWPAKSPPESNAAGLHAHEVAGRSVGTPAQTCLSEDIQLAEKVTPKSLGVAKSVLC